MSEVGTPQPHNLDKPHVLVASNNNNNNNNNNNKIRTIRPYHVQSVSGILLQHVKSSSCRYLQNIHSVQDGSIKYIMDIVIGECIYKGITFLLELPHILYRIPVVGKGIPPPLIVYK